MVYYREKKILFIHIPKTGGSNIEEELRKNMKDEKLFGKKGCNGLNVPYNNLSLQHLFYKTIFDNRKKLNVNFENLKVFTIVRNPYNKIISDLFFLNLASVYNKSDEIYDIIKNRYLGKAFDNHFQPQYKYITDNSDNLIPSIKIFRTETLNETNDELNKYLDINIKIKEPKNKNKDYSKYLNKDSIKLINEYYKKDFELFNYEMIKVD